MPRGKSTLTPEQLQALLALIEKKPGPNLPAYTCPNRGCGSLDTIHLAIITRPIPGKPWEHDPVGSVVKCAKCGEQYAITLEERYAPAEMTSRTPQVLREAMRANGVPNDMIDRLMDDVRVPSAE